MPFLWSFSENFASIRTSRTFRPPNRQDAGDRRGKARYSVGGPGPAGERIILNVGKKTETYTRLNMQHIFESEAAIFRVFG